VYPDSGPRNDNDIWNVQTSLFCDLVELIEEGNPVVPPEGLVYSTDPRKATGTDQCTYFVKQGPDRNVVVSEAIAYQLARHLNLKVPACGVGPPDETGNTYFASREVDRPQRQIETWFRRDRVTNRRDIAKTIVFDIWVMNYDRNIGNFVGSGLLPPDEGKIELIAIDFEKSAALRGPYPLVSSNDIAPQQLWPRDTLGQLLVGATIPGDFCDAVGAVTEAHILDAFAKLEARLVVPIEWKESTAQLLMRRAAQIHVLAREVWR
jgi:hypothetical protein